MIASARIDAVRLARLALAVVTIAPFATFCLSLAACVQVDDTPRRSRPDAGDLSEYEQPDYRRNRLPQPGESDYVNEDAGVFGPGDRPAPRPSADASTDGGEAEFPYQPCKDGAHPGDLVVVEMMVQSAAGAGDKGEWIELKNTRDCALDITGLRVSSPRGAAADTATVIGPSFLAPQDRLVVATHEDLGTGAPFDGIVALFEGDVTDVLKNEGDTVNVELAGTTLDSVTFPRFTGFQVGRSISFPTTCAAQERTNWERWSYSSAEWTSTLKATPGKDNGDIACY